MSDLTFKLALLGVNLYAIGAVFTFEKYKLDHEKYVKANKKLMELLDNEKYNQLKFRDLAKAELKYGYAYRPVTGEVLFSICVGWPIVWYSAYKSGSGN